MPDVSCSGCGHVPPSGSCFCDRCGSPLARRLRGRSVGDGCSAGDPSRLEWGRWIDPTEGAFSARVPQGWQVRGGIDRTGAVPGLQFEARGDPAGLKKVVVGGASWMFQDAPENTGGMWGGVLSALSGSEVLSYRPAAAFAQTWLMDHFRRRYPDVSLAGLQHRPDLVAALQQRQAYEMAARGMGNHGVECTVVDLRVTYAEQGVRFLACARVQTTRFISGMAAYMAAPLPWVAELTFACRAPQEEFSRWEPVLRTIAESVQMRSAWEQAQLASDNARALLSQQQIHMRQQQISQTLSETSDIVADAWWSKEQIRQQHEMGRHEAPVERDWSQKWSDAMLGVEERVDDTGRRFSVEAGHERVWRDDQENFYTGGPGLRPDPSWHELKLTGQ